MTDKDSDRVGAIAGRASAALDKPLTRPLPPELGLRIVEHELRERARLYELLASS